MSDVFVNGKLLPTSEYNYSAFSVELNEPVPQGTVVVIEKKNYKNGKLTKGKVKKILTNKRNHPRGIKVMLDDGTVGRVQDIL